MERDCESELSKLNIEQNACIYHFGASVIHGQRSNILRLQWEKCIVQLFQHYLKLGGVVLEMCGLPFTVEMFQDKLKPDK